MDIYPKNTCEIQFKHGNMLNFNFSDGDVLLFCCPNKDDNIRIEMENKFLDIKNGAIVETRNGQRFLKIDKTLLNMTMDGSFIALDGYYDNLKYSRYADSEYDIMKILNPHNNIFKEESCNLAVWSVKKLGKYVVWTWERKEKKKIKLKDLTPEQYKKWCKDNCSDTKCTSCIFYKVSCGDWRESCWIKNKDVYNEKFLNQELEIEEE